MPDPEIANPDQRANWNTASGPTWVELQPVLDRMLAPFATLLIQEGFPGPGCRVLDIGCGAGATTLAMARRLGPDGHCLGADISAPLVAAARARAADERIDTAAFVEADAQTHAFEAGTFDAVISRFGVMFFDRPEVAFTNVRRAARPGGRFTFIAWRSPAENAAMGLGARAAAPLLPPATPPDPRAPGQFAFADDARVRAILEAAGWSDIEIAPVDATCEIAEADLHAYATRLGPVGAALRGAGAALRERIEAVVMDAYAPHVADGWFRFQAACWRVRARA
jgi:SAM-dependent methyltransferase